MKRNRRVRVPLLLLAVAALAGCAPRAATDTRNLQCPSSVVNCLF